ncbi:hypothetical protein DFQ27_008966 [Actinomortierella ambigua]|uniref:Uncharacterized protein n=1 Tax=Actinomortierella ambigua TaxID=1343610 RepID=A0A9P6TY41_9FUNG|nr:hypothetical protein DFQ27_008966 [Actinomortierella ambigua]
MVEPDSDSSDDPSPNRGKLNALERMDDGQGSLRPTPVNSAETVYHAPYSRRAGQSSASAGSRKGSREETTRGSGGSDDLDRHTQKKYRRGRQSHGGGDDEDEGFLARTWSELKHHWTNCATECRVSACFTRCRKSAQEIASCSNGWVWVTSLVELATLLVTASSQAQKHSNGDTLAGRLSWLTNWNDFLRPFFAYNSALFLAPTLLSLIFNVDRVAARQHRKHEKEDHDVQQQQQQHQARLTGLLSNRTTSGLSFFVFRFALTYLLMHHFPAVTPEGGHGHISHQLHHHIHHHGHHHLPYLSVQEFCQWLGEAFRYVPATVSLAMSGTGTVLALAEIIVTRR